MSGTIIELRQGSAHARIAPALGARVTCCSLQSPDGQVVEVLHPYPEDHRDLVHWSKGGVYPLIPYWGRIANAQLMHRGEQFVLTPHPDSTPHTLHGTSHQHGWEVVDAETSQVKLRLEKEADPHWPWRYRAEMTVSLEQTSLRIDLSLCNTDDRPAPAGIGLHPYLKYSEHTHLSFEAYRQWAMTPDFLGVFSTPVLPEDGRHELHAIELDDFTRCYSEWNGTLALTDPANAGASLNVRATSALTHLVLHHPSGAPYVCVEPVSHTADAFNLTARGVLGTGARMLAPGQILAGSVEFSLDCNPHNA